MRAAALLLALPLALGCEPPAAPTETTRQPIIGGSIDIGDPAVAMLLTAGGGCTGTVISPRVILTAGHCVSDAIENGQSGSGTVSFGQGGDEGFTATIGVADMVMYRLYEPPAFLQYDLAAIRLEEDAPDGIDPIPVNYEILTDDYLGLPLKTVGFGVTDGAAQTGSGTKRQVSLTLDELTYFHIGLGQAGSNICQGDSGGPTFADFDGEQRIVGVASFGSDECQNRSYITRTDLYQDWIELVQDAWDGPCRVDGTCVTDGCRNPDPDCDVCGFDGVCGEDCPSPDLDCPLGKRLGDACDDAFECEDRVCLEAPDAPGVSYCSIACDPEDPRGCSPPLGACVERDGAHVCEYDGTTPGTQGAACDESDDCRVGVCDPDDDICVAQCGDGFDACPEGYECRGLGDAEACRLPADGGGCGCRGGGDAGLGAALGLALLALAARRRRA
jgi:MYXO-CTERM domain-containing protein